MIQPPHTQYINKGSDTFGIKDQMVCDMEADGCLKKIKVGDEYWIVEGKLTDLVTCNNPACTHLALDKLGIEEEPDETRQA